MKPLRISATTLGSLNLPGVCLGCFWIGLHYQGSFPFQIPMPGIFSTIDAYSKKVVHRVFDQGNGLPTWLPDPGAVQSYVEGLHHSWFTYEDTSRAVTLTGTPDDIFALADGSYHIVDYKTSRITNAQDGLFPQYDVQLNAYAYIAERLTKRDPLSPISALSLVYFEPQTDVDLENVPDLASGEVLPLPFKPALRPIDLRPNELIPPLLSRVREIFDKGQPPEHRAGCKNLERIHQLLTLVQR